MRHIKLLAFFVLLMLIPAFYNGYALFYVDSASYIHSGFTGFFPKDRPVFYGLFIKIISLSRSLWFIIIIQNFLLALGIYEVLGAITDDRRRKKIFPILGLFLVICTSIGWYSNQIMPDYFISIALLFLYVILTKSLPWYRLLAYALVILFSLIVHYSHSIIFIFAALTFLIMYRKNSEIFHLKNILTCILLPVTAFFTIACSNFIHERKFSFSGTSHVFFMAHLADNGMLKKFLKDNCDSEKFKDCTLCDYKENLPHDLGTFLWDSTSVLYKTGGWLNSESEYKKIIRETFTRPKYLLSHFTKTLSYTGIQLTRNKVGDGIVKYDKGSQVYTQLFWQFNDELNYYLNSAQYNGVLKYTFETVSAINVIIIIFSIILVILIVGAKLASSLSSNSVMFLIFSIISIISNAIFTAGLNAPSDRFQGRLSSLLPLACFILVTVNYRTIITSLKRT